MNVLVVAPHPDDEAIACGGSICLHADRGDRVTVVFLTSGELGLKHLPAPEAWRIREAEAEAAAQLLGVAEIRFLRQPDWILGEHVPAAAEALADVLRRERPELAYVPHAGESHPDHQAAVAIFGAAAALTDCRVREVRTYEVWTPLPSFDHVEDVTRAMARKLEAIRCYRSQLTVFRYDRAARGLSQYRGVMAGHCRYAEVFKRADGSGPGADRNADGAAG